MHLSCFPCVLHAPFISFLFILSGEEYRSQSFSLCSPFHSPVNSSLLGPNVVLSILSSNTRNLHSYFNVTDQDSHPYKTKGKMIVLYTLKFIYLESGRQKIRHGMTASILWLQPALLKLTALREFVLLPSLGGKLEYWILWNLSFTWLWNINCNLRHDDPMQSRRWFLSFRRSPLPTSVSHAGNVETLRCWLTASHLGVTGSITIWFM